MSDLVGNPEDRFSRVEAHIKVGFKGIFNTRTSYPDDEILATHRKSKMTSSSSARKPCMWF